MNFEKIRFLGPKYQHPTLNLFSEYPKKNTVIKKKKIANPINCCRNISFEAIKNCNADQIVKTSADVLNFDSFEYIDFWPKIKFESLPLKLDQRKAIFFMLSRFD